MSDEACASGGRPAAQGPPPKLWRPQIDPSGASRGKVPRFDGCSLREWQRVCQKRPDVSVGGLPLIHPAVVQAHDGSDPDALWVVYDGVVYDVTLFQRFHPGGEAVLRQFAGADVTDAYNYYHRWVSCEGMLGRFAVGRTSVPLPEC